MLIAREEPDEPVRGQPGLHIFRMRGHDVALSLILAPDEIPTAWELLERRQPLALAGPQRAPDIDCNAVLQLVEEKLGAVAG